MQQAFEERAVREKVAYDTGLKRRAYNRVLDHAHYHYRRKRVALIGEALRRVPHRSMLEIGCDAWLYYAEPSGVAPETLICTNISERELAQGVSAARTTRLQPDFRLMDAHILEFPDHSFDVVFGMSILHHLELERVLKEIRRVLKPSGHLLFTEPLDINLVGRLVRRLTPEARTEDERPFRDHDLRLLQTYFDCRLHYEQLLSVPAGVVSGLVFDNPDNPLTRAAFWLDERLVQAVPAMGRHFRSVIIEGRPRAVLPG